MHIFQLNFYLRHILSEPMSWSLQPGYIPYVEGTRLYLLYATFHLDLFYYNYASLNICICVQATFSSLVAHAGPFWLCERSVRACVSMTFGSSSSPPLPLLSFHSPSLPMFPSLSLPSHLFYFYFYSYIYYYFYFTYNGTSNSMQTQTISMFYIPMPCEVLSHRALYYECIYRSHIHFGTN